MLSCPCFAFRVLVARKCHVRLWLLIIFSSLGFLWTNRSGSVCLDVINQTWSPMFGMFLPPPPSMFSSAYRPLVQDTFPLAFCISFSCIMEHWCFVVRDANRRLRKRMHSFFVPFFCLLSNVGHQFSLVLVYCAPLKTNNYGFLFPVALHRHD